MRRHLHRQLRGAILKHLKHTGVIPSDAVMTTQIQTATWESRLLLGLVGAGIGVLGAFVMNAGSIPLIILGWAMVIGGIVLVFSAVRGRRKTVREYLGRVWDSTKRETEEKLEELVRKCLSEGGILDTNSLLGGAEMPSAGANLGDMGGAVAQLGDTVLSSGLVDVGVGDAAGDVADRILDGVFSGL